VVACNLLGFLNMKNTVLSKEGNNPSGQDQSADDATIHDILLMIIEKWRAKVAEAVKIDVPETKKESNPEDRSEKTVILSMTGLNEDASLIPEQKRAQEPVMEETVIISTAISRKEDLTVIGTKESGLQGESESKKEIDQLTTESKEINKFEEKDIPAETIILKLTDKGRQKSKE